jgi:NAD(P)-dependent dehydrogenase (short-subunit alcohol dehydrogenase family)
MTELAGRAVLVTGASGGLGRGIALACAAAGAGVVVAARRTEAGEAVAAQIRARGGAATFARCDVTSRADVGAAVGTAVRAYGGLDALIHNATSDRSSEPVDLEDADAACWDAHASVSLRGSLYCAAAGYRALRERRGTLILLTSPAAVEGSERLPFYAAGKARQRGMVTALAQEWGPEGVRVNGIAPLARTPALDSAFARDPALADRLAARIPLRRLGDSQDDIGPAAVFLCGDGARYITGHTLVVTGGR